VSTRYARAPHALWRQTYDRVVVLVPPSDEILTLTGSGVDLWHVFAQARSIAEAADALAAGHAVERAIVERDIAPIVRDLAARGALAASE